MVVANGFNTPDNAAGSVAVLVVGVYITGGKVGMTEIYQNPRWTISVSYIDNGFRLTADGTSAIIVNYTKIR